MEALKFFSQFILQSIVTPGAAGDIGYQKISAQRDACTYTILIIDILAVIQLDTEDRQSLSSRNLITAKCTLEDIRRLYLWTLHNTD